MIDSEIFAGDNMIKHYLMIFLVSMVPLIELRGAVPIAMTMDLA